MSVASDQYFLGPHNVRRLLSILPIALQCLSPLINISYNFIMSVASDQYFLGPHNVRRLLSIVPIALQCLSPLINIS